MNLFSPFFFVDILVKSWYYPSVVWEIVLILCAIHDDGLIRNVISYFCLLKSCVLIERKSAVLVFLCFTCKILFVTSAFSIVNCDGILPCRGFTPISF